MLRSAAPEAIVEGPVSQKKLEDVSAHISLGQPLGKVGRPLGGTSKQSAYPDFELCAKLATDDDDGDGGDGDGDGDDDDDGGDDGDLTRINMK